MLDDASKPTGRDSLTIRAIEALLESNIDDKELHFFVYPFFTR